jgi:hypothetical protein
MQYISSTKTGTFVKPATSAPLLVLLLLCNMERETCVFISEQIAAQAADAACL